MRGLLAAPTLLKASLRACTAIIAMAGLTAASAQTPGQPFTNIQPSLALTEVTPTGAGGNFPSFTSGGALGDTDGFIYNFAGDYAPSGSVKANGQLLPITGNSTVFSLMGTTYGGDGTTNFGVPNLIGQAAIGAGAGAGLPTQTLGVATGSPMVTLTIPNLPAPAGSGLTFSNLQPSLPLIPLIAVSGSFPSMGTTNGPAFVGQIAYYAGSLGSSNQFLPNGWAVADGSTMTFAAHPALGSVLGDQFGGNGSTTFALPNLLGRVAVGATTTNPIGTQFGQADTSLTTAQLPPGGTPVNDDEPSLSVNYIIATQGIFPSSGGASGGFSETTATLGEIVAFGGNYAPAGWDFANGQTLLDTSNEALFNVIGTMYGSGGPGTFDLPDLDGRTIIGADGSSILPGFEEGVDSVTLTTDNIPTGASDVPEPASVAVLGFGLVGILGARRRRRLGNHT
jgi:microcystin-dependent protein